MKNTKYVLSLVFVLFILLIGLSVASATSNATSTTKKVDVKKTSPSINKDVISNTKKIDNTKLNKKETNSNKNNQMTKKDSSKSITVSNYKQLAKAVEESKALDGSSYTINLKKGTYTDTGKITWGYYTRKSGKVSSLTINGNGATINGNSKQFLIVNPQYTLTVNDLTIKNTKTPAGASGAENAASGVNGLQYSTVNINNCKFINNVGAEKGGAVVVRGTGNIKNSEFTSNTAKWGSAIYTRADVGSVKLTVSNSKFQSHKVANNLNGNTNEKMALIYLCGKGTATLKNNQFINNNGRPIHAYRVNVNIIGNEFKGNKIIDTRGGNIVDSRVVRGGLIDSYESTTNVEGNKFYSSNVLQTGSSSGVNGGVLYHEIGKLTVSDNVFENVASAVSIKQNGGAVFVRNATATISYNTFKNTFTGNRVCGGAVYTNEPTATVTLDENIFTNVVKSPNSRGGAVLSDGGRLILSGNTFASKVSGGNNAFNSYVVWSFTGSKIIPGKTTIINKVATKLSLKSVVGYPGEKVTFTATAKKNNNALMSGGKVQFYLKDSLIGTKAVSKGVAKLTYVIPKTLKGKSTVLAKYIPAGNYKRSESKGTLTVNKKSVSLSLKTKNTTYTKSKFMKIDGTIKSSGKKVKEGKVALSVNGKKIKTLTIKKGIISTLYKMPTKTPIKTYKVTANYLGTNLYKTAKKTTKIKM